MLQHEVAVEHSSAPCYAVHSKRVVFSPTGESRQAQRSSPQSTSALALPDHLPPCCREAKLPPRSRFGSGAGQARGHSSAWCQGVKLTASSQSQLLPTGCCLRFVGRDFAF